MPPVRTLVFLVPLVKALRPRTMPAKQLSTASSMKARVASQKAGPQTHNQQVLAETRATFQTLTHTCGVRVAFVADAGPPKALIG